MSWSEGHELLPVPIRDPQCRPRYKHLGKRWKNQYSNADLQAHTDVYYKASGGSLDVESVVLDM